MKKFIVYGLSILLLVLVVDKCFAEEGSHSKHEGSGGDSRMQEAQMEIMKWPSFYDCAKTESILKIVVGNNKERPIIESVGIIQTPPQEDKGEFPVMIQAPVIQYYNEEKGTYSIVAHFKGGYSCILLFGHGIKKADQSKIELSPDKWKEHLKSPEITVDPSQLEIITDDQKFNLT